MSILESSSFRDVLLSRSIQFRQNLSDSAEITICCPFCYEKRFRLGLNLARDLAHCFNCNWSSRHAIRDLSRELDLGALASAAEHSDERGEQEDVSKAPVLPDDFTLLSCCDRKGLYRTALEYLLDRGVKQWQIEAKHIGVSMTGQFAYRVVFPVYYGRELQGLVGRDFTGKQERKYLNSFGKRAVYNSPVHKKSKAVLCEGIFDCLALERVVPVENYDVLALLGHDLTEQQEERLDGYRDVILWPDADLAGVDGFLRVAKRLLLHHRVFMVLPSTTAKDAGDMSAVELSYQWASRTRYRDSLELKMRAGVALHE